MTRYRYWITLGASIVIALVFLTAGVGKLLGQSAFLLEVLTVIVEPAVAGIIASVLPWVEIILGVCLLVGIAPQIVSGISILIIASFIFHNSWVIGQGSGYEPCGCLGVFDKLFQGRLSTVGSLYIDIGLLILALAIYFGYQGKVFNIRPWFWNRKANDLSNDDQDN